MQAIEFSRRFPLEELLPAVSHVRFVVGVFYVLGGASLAMTLAVVMLGGTPRLGLSLAGVGYILAAWQLSRGSAVAHVVLAILSVVSIASCVLAGLVARQDRPVPVILGFPGERPHGGNRLFARVLAAIEEPTQGQTFAKRWSKPTGV